MPKRDTWSGTIKHARQVSQAIQVFNAVRGAGAGLPAPLWEFLVFASAAGIALLVGFWL
jgi:hypothetical protein